MNRQLFATAAPCLFAIACGTSTGSGGADRGPRGEAASGGSAGSTLGAAAGGAHAAGGAASGTSQGGSAASGGSAGSANGGNGGSGGAGPGVATVGPGVDGIVGLAYSTWEGSVFGHCPDACWGTPALGGYDSSDPAVIRQHAAWIAAAGIDYISEDWSNDTAYVYGSATPDVNGVQYLEQNMLTLYDTYAKMDAEGAAHPKVAIMLGGSLVKDADGTLSVQRKANQVASQFLDYSAHPEYKSINFQYLGKPVAYMYGLNTWDYTNNQTPPFADDRFTMRYGWAWFSRQNQYAVQLSGLKTIQADLNWPYVEDSRFLNNPNDMPSEGAPVSMYQGQPEMVNVEAQQNADNFALNNMTRDDGQYYRSRWAYARAVNPKIIYIASFNEWLKGVGPDEPNTKDIEPQKGGHGDLYMEITRQEIAAWKGTPAGANVARVYQRPVFGFVPDGATSNGYAVDLPAGSYSSVALAALGVADKSIASILLQPGYKVLLCQESECNAPSARAYRDVTDVTALGLNGQISSLVICPTAVQANDATGAGLVGQYFANSTFGGAAVLTSTDAVDFAWGATSPIPGRNAQAFSVEWTGYLRAPTNGPYFFKTNAAGSVKVWIDGQLVLDNEHPGNSEPLWPRAYSYAISLDAGETVPIKVQYVSTPDAARMQLLWRHGAAAGPNEPQPTGDLVNDKPSGYTVVPRNVYTTRKSLHDCAP